MRPLRIVGPIVVGLILSACDAPAEAAPLVELDHVFVAVPDPAPAVAALFEAGITVDTSGVARHDGNGTASVPALFDNAYLEILWLEPVVPVSEEAADELEVRRQAAEWRPDGPAPFGIGPCRAREGLAEFPSTAYAATCDSSVGVEV